MPSTSDIRIRSVRPLISPAILEEELPLSDTGASQIQQSRREVADIILGQDDRLLAIVGPCSVHDPAAALEYARKLQPLAARLSQDLLVVMRVYFEKPRTVVGWKGLINDPGLDGSFQINKGLRLARKLLLEVTEVGLPIATEFFGHNAGAVLRRPDFLGRHWGAHHREPGAPRAGVGLVDAGGFQEPHRW